MKNYKFIALAIGGILLTYILLNFPMKLTEQEYAPEEVSQNRRHDPSKKAEPANSASVSAPTSAAIPKKRGELPATGLQKSEPDARAWGLLLTDAMKGKEAAILELETLATNSTNDQITRETAMRMLGQIGNRRGLDVLFNLLGDKDGSVRTAAFYSLPITLQPKQFDYTSNPTEDSINQLQRIKNELLR